MYSEEIKQIHKDFYTASDKVLEEAQAIIADPNKLAVNKAQLLKRIGFERAVGVKEGIAISKKMEMTSENAEIVTNYQRRNQKFISDEDVAIILEKYNLVMGITSLYTGFVPAKNLEEIKDFKKDNNYTRIFVGKDYEIRNNVNFPGWNGRKKFLEKFNAMPSLFKILDTYSSNPERFQYTSHSDLMQMHKKLIGVSVKEAESVYMMSDEKGEPTRIFSKIEGSMLDTFLICAPAKDFDLKEQNVNNNIVSPVKSRSITIQEKPTPPDPVVLWPVKKGYVIVTAWGDEADDELIKQ